MIGLFGRSRIMTSDEVLTIFRETGPPALVDGKPVKKPSKQFEIQANVQPLTGLDLLRVPELDRHTERFWVYTNEISQPLELNDTIARSGVNYQVEKVETWGKPPNGYQRAQIVRIDVGPRRTP